MSKIDLLKKNFQKFAKFSKKIFKKIFKMRFFKFIKGEWRQNTWLKIRKNLRSQILCFYPKFCRGKWIKKLRVKNFKHEGYSGKNLHLVLFWSFPLHFLSKIESRKIAIFHLLCLPRKRLILVLINYVIKESLFNKGNPNKLIRKYY